MLYFSALLFSSHQYQGSVSRLYSALNTTKTAYQLLDHTKDIWLRDFMPVKTGAGRYVSFRYEPSYLDKDAELRTDFRQDIAPHLSLPVAYSDINLDGGNVLFSPSRQRAILSDRVFAENPNRDRVDLIGALESLLEAEVIIIPSLPSDMTGHADGMVRFLDENTILGNRMEYRYGLEQRIKSTLQSYGLTVLDFPYHPAKGSIDATGSYLNYLETKNHLFLPVFGIETDQEAIDKASELFRKPIVPVNIAEIAKDGGCLNCISWETEQ